MAPTLNFIATSYRCLNNHP